MPEHEHVYDNEGDGYPCPVKGCTWDLPPAVRPTTAEKNEAIYQRITGGKAPKDAKQRIEWIQQAQAAMARGE